jgi:hypothetical protein
MNANRTHANRPTAITRADIVRQRVAVARHDATIRAKRATERRAAWLSRICIVVGMIAVFHAITN